MMLSSAAYWIMASVMFCGELAVQRLAVLYLDVTIHFRYRSFTSQFSCWTAQVYLRGSKDVSMDSWELRVICWLLLKWTILVLWESRGQSLWLSHDCSIMMFWPLNFTPLFLTFLNNYKKIMNRYFCVLRQLVRFT